MLFIANKAQNNHRRMATKNKITRKQELEQEMHNNQALVTLPFNPNTHSSNKNHTQSKVERGFHSYQKKLQTKTDIMKKPQMRASQSIFSTSIRNWQFVSQHKRLAVKQKSAANNYYPPSCSGYDMAYCKTQNAIYIYGGISCSSSFSQGIKQYFYKYCESKWSEVKHESLYNPIPRYGHTLTPYHKELILFGGVSQYKQKLKDRCFYTDFSAYSVGKSSWRLLQTQGMNNKARKNHSAVVYNKYYIVYGGLDESEQVVNELSWVNLQCKKPRWKSFALPGRFNNKMVVVQSQNDKDFLCIFGGRNEKSQIVNTMFFIPLSLYEGQLAIREKTEIPNSLKPRQMPIIVSLSKGFVILGGINQNNEIVEDGWQYDTQTQTLNKLVVDLCFGDLRGARACSILGQKIFLMTGSSTKAKTLQLQLQK